jgi:aminoglycoside 2'-N-acetyltransferase I
MTKVPSKLRIEVIEDSQLSADDRTAILSLCNRAFKRDLTELMSTFPNPVHVVGYLDGLIVSHAMWVERRLQVGDGLPLRSAYIEMVAVEPARQRQGYGTETMRRIREEILGYELGALWPDHPDFYARLGWEAWRGPLFIRKDAGLQATPQDRVMVLRLPKTPPLDLGAPLSAEWRAGELW